VLDALVPGALWEPDGRGWPARLVAARAVVAVLAGFAGALLGALGGMGAGAVIVLLYGPAAGPFGALAGSALGVVVAIVAAGPVGVALRAVAVASDRVVSRVGNGEWSAHVMGVVLVVVLVGAIVAGIVFIGPHLELRRPVEYEGALRAFGGAWCGFACGFILVVPVAALVEALARMMHAGGRFVALLPARRVVGAADLWARTRAGVLAGVLVGTLVCAGGVTAAALVAPDGIAAAAAVGGAVGPVVGGVAGAVAAGAARWREDWLVRGPKAELSLLWRSSGRTIVPPRPTFQFSNGALHSERGPAVCLPWREAYCWRGRLLTAHTIRMERDPAERRAMLACYGVDRYLDELGAELVHEDGCGRLWRGRFFPSVSEPVELAVEVRDATSGERFLLRVPPTTETAREGIAWSFDLAPDQYAPAVEA
jgi:hypothetical protein